MQRCHGTIPIEPVLMRSRDEAPPNNVPIDCDREIGTVAMGDRIQSVTEAEEASNQVQTELHKVFTVLHRKKC